eukprot:3581024-Alexandrium_andersonii.AAC.1
MALGAPRAPFKRCGPSWTTQGYPLFTASEHRCRDPMPDHTPSGASELPRGPIVRHLTYND